jgi:hypothetical protein
LHIILWLGVSGPFPASPSNNKVREVRPEIGRGQALKKLIEHRVGVINAIYFYQLSFIKGTGSRYRIQDSDSAKENVANF